MKKLSFFAFVLLVMSCGSDDAVNTRHDSIKNSKDSLRAEADRQDAYKNCCFQSPNDFDPFFPDTCGQWMKQSSKAELLCNKDTLAHNTVLVTYANERGHLVVARLTEYCTAPEMLATDFSLKYEMHKSTAEFNAFDVPPTHHGFSTYNKRESAAYLLVVIDDRFLVEITDQVCENNKKVLEIYADLPLNKLAEFGR